MQKHNLADHVTGTWIPEIRITITYEDTGNPVDLTGATVRIYFQHLDIGAEAHQMSSLTGEGLMMINASGGIIAMNPQSIDWEPGTFEFEVWVEYATGPKHVYLGGLWKIEQNRRIDG